tara:strand:+ start:1268 stop:2485 length:1218 start_codon:yes stop_codon:yes gene_type:complete
MQEDLRHIELIDKYLRGRLNPSEKDRVDDLLLNDSEFVKEVAVYRKIYEGIAQTEKTDLKKRLGGYFEDYKNDQKIAITNKPKGRYRKLYTYGGAIAACLVIGAAILFLNKYEATISNPRPNIVDVDTTNATKKTDSIFNFKEEELAEEPKQDKPEINEVPDDNLVNQDQKKDSIQLPSNIDDVQLAFGGYKTLPRNVIRSYTFLESLSYTFHSGVFKLYGDPLVGRLDGLQIIKNEESKYLLSFKNKYYSIEETERRMRLREVKNTQDNNGLNTLFNKPKKLTPSQEEVSIAVVAIENTSVVLSDLIVRYDNEEVINQTYFFAKNEENLELFINADLDKEKAMVYRIRESGEIHYYLVQENQIYELNEKAKEPTPLVIVDITTNKLARLFIAREPIKTVVYKEK